MSKANVKVGAPRRPEVIARDERVLAAIIELGSEGGVRVATLHETCKIENRHTLVYALERLVRAGKIERRGGYLWWPVLDN